MRFHLEQSELHQREALAAIRAREFGRGRKELLLAARYLLEAAREAEPALRRARAEKAQRIKQQADSLPEDSTHKLAIESGNQGEHSGTGEQEWMLSETPNVHFDDVAGLDDVKQAIQLRVIYPLRHPEVARRFNKRAGGGILLYGPPGTGKTLIARAIATELDARFFNVKASNIMSPWVGVAEKNFARLFDSARKYPVAVIFLDETEALVGKRGSHSTVMNRVIPEFLAQLDGVEKNQNSILLVGATNRPWDMDEAALRTGRFGEQFYVGLPDLAAREQILSLHLSGVPGSETLDVRMLAEKLEGYSGADISGVCLKATDLPFRREIDSSRPESVTQGDLERAIREVQPSVDHNQLNRYERFRAAS
jgi:transitional endoplasmic reticulum ATPase